MLLKLLLLTMTNCLFKMVTSKDLRAWELTQDPKVQNEERFLYLRNFNRRKKNDKSTAREIVQFQKDKITRKRH